jgi:phosphate acetyltransferase
MTRKATVSQLHRHEKYERLIAATVGLAPLPAAIAHPCDETSLRGAMDAARQNMIDPILVGPRQRIVDLAKSCDINLGEVEIVDVSRTGKPGYAPDGASATSSSWTFPHIRRRSSSPMPP